MGSRSISVAQVYTRRPFRGLAERRCDAASVTPNCNAKTTSDGLVPAWGVISARQPCRVSSGGVRENLTSPQYDADDQQQFAAHHATVMRIIYIDEIS